MEEREKKGGMNTPRSLLRGVFIGKTRESYFLMLEVPTPLVPFYREILFLTPYRVPVAIALLA